jgi:hypothetical protein
MPLLQIRKPLRTVLILPAIVVVTSAISDIRSSVNVQAPLLAGAQIPPRVHATLDRACRDCHSEATRYPWYSYIAPVSFLVNRDVRVGREHLNFSRWSEYSIIRRERCLSEIANQVQDGGMPMAIYVAMHPSARLSGEEVRAIFEWTQAERARLITEGIAADSAR